MKTHRNYLTAAISLVIAGGSMSISTAALAQAKATTSGENQSADNRLMVEEVVVTSRKIEEKLQEAPVSVTAFSEKGIEDRGITNMEDLAAFTPGFDFSQSFGRQDFRPAIRGQSNVQGGSNAGLFVDGIYVGKGAPTVPYAALQTVEVVKGPQAVLYGRSTLAGAINYVLKKPTEEFEGAAEVTLGEDNLQHQDITLSGPITKELGYMFSAGYSSVDGQYRNQYPGKTWTNPAANGGGTTSTKPNDNLLGGERGNGFVSVLDWKPSDNFTAIGRISYDATDDDPYAIATQSAEKNNCYQNVTVTPNAAAKAKGVTAGQAYNGSGYYCGDVDVGKARDAGAPALEYDFYNDPGVSTDAFRTSATLEWNVQNFLLTSNTSWSDYNENASQDTSFGAPVRSYAAIPGNPPQTASASVRGGDVWLVPFGGGYSRFGFNQETHTDYHEWSQEFRIASPTQERFRYMAGLFGYGNYTSEFERTSNNAISKQTGNSKSYAAFADDAINFNLINQGTQRRENYAGYGQVEFDSRDDLTWTAGVRYNQEKLTFDGGPSNINYEKNYYTVLPRVSVDWHVTDDSMIYAIAAKGNKPGDLNTEAGLSNDQRVVDEEYAFNYELGIKNTLWDGRATANFAVYYTDWRDQQLTNTVVLPSGGTTSVLDNVGKSDVKGFEMDLAVAATEYWDISLAYAYTDTNVSEYLIEPTNTSSYKEPIALGFDVRNDGDVNIKDVELPQVSKNSAAFSNAFHGPLYNEWDWMARVDYIFNSSRYDQVYNLAETGDQKLVNLRAGITSEQIDLEFWIKNVTNDDTSPALIRYVEVQNGKFGPNRAVGATLPDKRQVGITARYRF